MRVLGRLPGGQDRGGRQEGLHPREAEAARSSLSSLVSAGTLFTYLDPALAKRPAAVDQQHDRGRGELAAEGRPAQPPGLTSVKRVKAVFWWCHAHSGDARTAREKLAAMPTDADIDFLFSVYSASRRARTEGRSGATGPCGRTSTTGTRTRSGLING